MKLKDTGLTAQDIKDKVKKYMIETYERFDFIAETAEGMYLYDENGTPYLDFYAGIAVNNAGSRNPKVVAAVKDQVDDIMHTFNYPYTIPQALLAEKVCKTIGMDKIFYQNSGTEANEAMIKMARKYGIEKYGPNRYHIVTAKDGFHGRTFGAMSATGQPGNGCQVGFGPMTYGFSYAPYNDLKAFKTTSSLRNSNIPWNEVNKKQRRQRQKGLFKNTKLKSTISFLFPMAPYMLQEKIAWYWK